MPRIASLLGKKHALLEVAKLLSTSSGLTESAIFTTLMDRGKLGATGFGRGVAVPHARVPRDDGTHMVYVRLARPVDFEAGDDKPVDLICAIIGSYESTTEPFEALVGARRVVRNPESLTKLRQVRNVVDFHSILAEES